MPTVVNGIGTWYYGKSRIHRYKEACSFCNGVGELESYDTTLYFVVFFVPLIPLSRKRILEQCPYCKKHRVIGLQKWEAIKAEETAQMLERLQQDPDDRANILDALALAIRYQDQSLFDQLASTLAEHRKDDAAILTRLGAGYAYFVRWPEAEAAYRAALALGDDPTLNRQLALALLKQSRPEEAEPLLRPILEQRLQDEAGLIYVLIEGYQAQGMHREALRLMDERDAAFPDFASAKEYQKQRKLSVRHLDSGKRISSSFLSESEKVGYREGGRGTRAARLIAPLLVLGLLILYLGSAIWIGQSRKIYVVNGWDRPYTVAVNGQEQKLQPGVPTPIRVPEGDVSVEFRDAQLSLEPVHCKVETSFFGRPFANRTFVINPDQLALLIWEKEVYSKNQNLAALAGEPPRVHTGQVLQTFDSIDYEFAPFPETIKVKGNSTIEKTRVSLPTELSAESRLNIVSQFLNANEQTSYAKRWLQLDPNNLYALSWLMNRVPDNEALEILRPGLSVRPIRVDWHRAYQHVIQKTQPDRDLQPEYQQLVTEMKDHPDALYLLARLLETEKADSLFRRAADATPPSMYAVHALGFDALSRGQFDEAVTWSAKAVQLTPEHAQVKRTHQLALFAAGQFDRLLNDFQSRQTLPGNISVLFERVRVLAAKGDQAAARTTLEELFRLLKTQGDQAVDGRYRCILEMILCCAANDVEGYLKLASGYPDLAPFEYALLRGNLKDAADSVDDGNDEERAIEQRAMLYLAARKADNQEIADKQWQQLLTLLGKDDHHSRRLAKMLDGSQPLDADIVRRLPIDPKQKRVLLAVVAHRHPDQAKDLLTLARTLDFQRDGTTLCLRKILE